MQTNEFGQPIGETVPGWTPRRRPDGSALPGRFCTVVRLDAEKHGDALFSVASTDEASAWTYLPYGPFDDRGKFREWLVRVCAQQDPLFHAIVDKASGAVKGFAAFMRMEPNAGVIEVGNVYFSRELRGSAAATEAMYLMMRHAMSDLGYRRYEWKCDALNAPSRRAAERLGFVYEGTFRQATIYKGRNRDTAWFSIIDREWPDVRRALERWLKPDNFDDAGRQRAPLRSLA
jgi:RimJ/RimL family protein N-acetyltransferase